MCHRPGTRRGHQGPVFTDAVGGTLTADRQGCPAHSPASRSAGVFQAEGHLGPLPRECGLLAGTREVPLG